jgi:hypothetical protein
LDELLVRGSLASDVYQSGERHDALGEVGAMSGVPRNGPPKPGDDNYLLIEEYLECPLPPTDGVARRFGVGPHQVVHIASGETALCGGPGYCRVCDE